MVPSPARRRGIGGFVVLPVVIAAILLLTSAPAAAGVSLTEIGADPFTGGAGQRGTQAGADTFHWGTTIVSAQQARRFADGGAAGITFATSSDNGATWSRGVLPGITVAGGGPYQRVSDPSVAYDVLHGVWLISSLALDDLTGAAVLISRSADGGRTWGEPVTAAAAGGGDLDKSWIVCDNDSGSPFHGTCYATFDDHAAGNAIKVARSDDGGLTWNVTGTSATGLGGQPVVRPDGTVVVAYLGNADEIRSFRSHDGGATWGPTVLVSRVQRHTVAGGLRAAPLPSAEVDASGTVYVVWQDCRFQLACGANDIVMSTSAGGSAWGYVTRVTSDGGDHFIPGLGVDRSSSLGTARLALAYYRYPSAACTAATCRLTVGYTSSANGGASWSEPVEIQGPMALDRLVASAQGPMAGDYVSTSVVPGGNAFPAFTVAASDVRTYTVTGGLPITGGGPATIAIEAPTASSTEPAPSRPRTAR
ncbi:sialidase family protein [Nonomuraea sp. NPDC046802]|uniref:sialidase family protein n=1 Tax=Nonomuraea sp. NPDC046802 TaxID=3154919 RepID=UPI0033FB8B68